MRRSRQNKTSSNCGFTLMELLTSMVVAVVLFAAIAALTQSGSLAMEHLGKAQQVSHEMKRGMDRLTETLKAAPQSSVTVNTSGADADSIRMQVTDPSSPMSTQLGYFDAAGVFRANFFAEFRVSNGTLELVALDDTQAVIATYPLCRDIDAAVDDAGVVTKGFQVVTNPPLVSFLLRVRTEFVPGQTFVRTEQTQVFQQNE